MANETRVQKPRPLFEGVDRAVVAFGSGLAENLKAPFQDMGFEYWFSQGICSRHNTLSLADMSDWVVGNKGHESGDLLAVNGDKEKISPYFYQFERRFEGADASEQALLWMQHLDTLCAERLLACQVILVSLGSIWVNRRITDDQAVNSALPLPDGLTHLNMLSASQCREGLERFYANVTKLRGGVPCPLLLMIDPEPDILALALNPISGDNQSKDVLKEAAVSFVEATNRKDVVYFPTIEASHRQGPSAKTAPEVAEDICKGMVEAFSSPTVSLILSNLAALKTLKLEIKRELDAGASPGEEKIIRPLVNIFQSKDFKDFSQCSSFAKTLLDTVSLMSDFILQLGRAESEKVERDRFQAVVHDSIDAFSSAQENLTLLLTPIIIEKICISFERADDWQGAAALLERGLTLFPNYGPFYFLMSRVKAKGGAFEEAVEWAEGFWRRKSLEPGGDAIWQGQDQAIARGIPPVIFIAQIKSASEYITETIERVYQLPAIFNPTLETTPHEFILPFQLERIAKGGVVSRLHLDASDYNIKALNDAGIKRFVVHFRDPRQTTVSFAHYVTSFSDEFILNNRHLYTPPLPRDINTWDLARRLNWAVENYYPGAVGWVRSWVEKEAEVNGIFQVHYTTFEDFIADPVAFIYRFIGLFDLPQENVEAELSQLPKEKTHNYRKGSKDEWRDVLTEAQHEKMSALMPKAVMDRFGWKA